MTTLIANLSSGQGTWTEVLKLIAQAEWDKIFIITNSPEQLQINKEVEFIVIDENQSVVQLRDQIYSKLKGKISGFEVALNLISGTGKEHMAIISAVLKCGLALRLVNASNSGVDEI